VIKKMCRDQIRKRDPRKVYRDPVIGMCSFQDLRNPLGPTLLKGTIGLNKLAKSTKDSFFEVVRLRDEKRELEFLPEILSRLIWRNMREMKEGEGESGNIINTDEGVNFGLENEIR